VVCRDRVEAGHKSHAHALRRRVGRRLAAVVLRRRTCNCWIWHVDHPLSKVWYYPRRTNTREAGVPLNRLVGRSSCIPVYSLNPVAERALIMT
jgi:hypothetical protein